MQHSVYWIRHKNHTDIFRDGYVGMSNNVARRFSEHKRGISSNAYLKHAISKYGIDNIAFEVILIAAQEYCLNVEKSLRPNDSIGWNLVSGGGKPPVVSGPRPNLCGRTPWNKGKKMSDSTKAKVSAAVKKQMSDPEHRKLLSLIKLGKPGHRLGIKHTVESIEKMRSAHKGKVSKKKGTKLSGIALENTIKASRVEWTCPHCSKKGMGKGAANRWHFDNCKSKDAE